MADDDPERGGHPASSDASALLAAIVASSNDAIVGRNLDGIVTAWNAAAERLFGFTEAEMIGRPITGIIPCGRRAEEAIILQRVRTGESLTHFETERLTRDGRIIPVSLTISPIRDAAGAIVGASKIARDLTEMQRMHDELRRREALLISIIDTVPDALVVIDAHGIIQSFSHAAERMFGYAAGETIGRNVAMLMGEPHAASHDAYLSRYLETGERHIIGIGRVVSARRKDGTIFPIQLEIGEVQVPGSHLFTGYVRDLTERRDRDRRLAELQSELIHVSRLSELGQMVSALAHEVNQPLTAITNYLSGIRRLLAEHPEPALAHAISKVAEQAERARGIVQSVRGLVKKDTRPSQVEDLETIINETSALALIGAARPVSVDLRIAPDARHAVVDRVQIQQVLLNLMRNAVEAMGAEPIRSLSVATSRHGDRIRIRVADTGPGLPPVVRAHLFQPFITTKAEGLGVGLSICRTIVEAHGGELVAENGPETGAVFHFCVPAAMDFS